MKTISEIRAANKETIRLAIAQACPFTMMKHYADADFDIIKRESKAAESRILQAVVEKIEGMRKLPLKGDRCICGMHISNGLNNGCHGGCLNYYRTALLTLKAYVEEGLK